MPSISEIKSQEEREGESSSNDIRDSKEFGKHSIVFDEEEHNCVNKELSEIYIMNFNCKSFSFLSDDSLNMNYETRFQEIFNMIGG